MLLAGINPTIWGMALDMVYFVLLAWCFCGWGIHLLYKWWDQPLLWQFDQIGYCVQWTIVVFAIAQGFIGCIGFIKKEICKRSGVLERS